MKVSLTSPPAAMDLDANRQLLNRYRFVEQETLRILAGWLPQTATFELKCEMGRAIWEDAQHVQALYLRLREVQSPAFQKPKDEALVKLMEEMWHAPDEFALAVALWGVVKPSLIAAMESHETLTFPNSDLPSVHAIHHILLDERGQIGRVEPLLRQADARGSLSPSVRQWEQYIRALLAAAGGLGGSEQRGAAPAAAPAARRQFQTPREAARDERFTNRGAAPGPMPPEEEYDRHTREEFERYSTEMLAAETVALVMHQLPDMPWEFHFDAARHLYDEVRHCRMGHEWMLRHGLDPFRAPQFLPVYRWRSQFSPVEQYCMLTMGNEVHAFPYRHRRVEAHERAGERLSEQFVRYDIADETQHVRFGKRWLPEMLRHVGERRSLEQFTADVLKVWEAEYKSGKLTISVE